MNCAVSPWALPLWYAKVRFAVRGSNKPHDHSATKVSVQQRKYIHFHVSHAAKTGLHQTHISRQLLLVRRCTDCNHRVSDFTLVFRRSRRERPHGLVGAAFHQCPTLFRAEGGWATCFIAHPAAAARKQSSFHILAIVPKHR